MIQEFSSFLFKELNASSEEDFLKKIDELGEEKVKDKYEKFLIFRSGGKLDYIKCLDLFKKGGSMKDCNCSKEVKSKKFSDIIMKK